MHISVTEWAALKLALRLPRAMLDPGLAAAAIRKHVRTRRGMAVAGCVLLALLVLLHVKTADPAVKRYTDLVAQLAGVKLIDARWDAAIVKARSDTTAAPARPAVHNSDGARIQRALEAAAAEAKTTALRTTITELRKAYVEKADVVGRLERASADSRMALGAALRADAAVTTLVRNAWRDFPQRDRLVAAENLVVRVISDAQQYYHAPTPAHRASLESYMSDLPRAQSLPKPVLAGLSRLESDTHQLLLLKPLEQMLFDRLGALDTAERVDQLGELYRQELADALARRDRWRIALIVYTLALVVLLAYLGVRAIARYRDLEVLYAGQTRELGKALRKLRGYEGGPRAGEAPPLDSAPPSEAEEEARILSAHRRQSGTNA